MSALESPRKELLDRLSPAAEGKGPLFQRDYWAVIDSCRTSPAGLMDILRFKFCELVPPQLVKFEKILKAEDPLDLGDEMTVKIRGAGTFGVRLVHLDRQSFTLATLRGHPEAGRITFGAYGNPRGDVIFHIRSRARSSSSTRYFSFLTAGEPMQTNTWCELINRTAASVGNGVIGFIRAQTQRVEDDEGDRMLIGPTFCARAD